VGRRGLREKGRAAVARRRRVLLLLSGAGGGKADAGPAEAREEEGLELRRVLPSSVVVQRDGAGDCDVRLQAASRDGGRHPRTAGGVQGAAAGGVQGRLAPARGRRRAASRVARGGGGGGRRPGGGGGRRPWEGYESDHSFRSRANEEAGLWSWGSLVGPRGRLRDGLSLAGL
jgi:hypothetical protein